MLENAKKRKLIFGSDAAGFFLKNFLIQHFADADFETEDCGCFSEQSCHYPEFAHKVCVKVRENPDSLGILVCGTGIGMSMAANKHRGIRAAACADTYSARLTRNHNNANVLCLGARTLGAYLAQDIADSFVGAEFEGGRHSLRVDMITKFESDDN